MSDQILMSHETPLPFAPVLEQVRLTTIEVLTGLTFPELRSFDPLLFDREGQPRTPIDDEGPEGLFSDEPADLPPPQTTAIGSMRDIVL